MIGHLYRYPHPTEPEKFLYVGQTQGKEIRDRRHRQGRRGFGARFKKKFPGVELPQPIIETFEVSNQLELNELETIWMFIYHTWHGYSGGMNMSFPGSADYKETGKLGSIIAGKRNLESGWAAELGRRSLESGHIFKITTKESRSKGGKQGIANGHLERIRNLPKTRQALRRVGLKHAETGQLDNIRQLPKRKQAHEEHLHIRWHTSRNRPSPRCVLCSEQSLIVAYA